MCWSSSGARALRVTHWVRHEETRLSSAHAIVGCSRLVALRCCIASRAMRCRPQPCVVTLDAGSAAAAGVAGRGGHRSGRRSRRAVDYAGARNTRALVVGRGGHIVFEKYWGDTTLDTPVRAAGFRAGAGVAAGRLGDERPADQRISTRRCLTIMPDRRRAATRSLPALARRQLMAQTTPATAPTRDRSRACSNASLKQPYEAAGCRAAVEADGCAVSFRFRRNGAERRGGPLAPSRGLLCAPRASATGCASAKLLANDGVFEGNQFTPPRYVQPHAEARRTRIRRTGFFTRVDGEFAARDVAWLEARGQATAVDRAVAAARDPARGR